MKKDIHFIDISEIGVMILYSSDMKSEKEGEFKYKRI